MNDPQINNIFLITNFHTNSQQQMYRKNYQFCDKIFYNKFKFRTATSISYTQLSNYLYITFTNIYLIIDKWFSIKVFS
jgi:hypothetical protein